MPGNKETVEKLEKFNTEVELALEELEGLDVTCKSILQNLVTDISAIDDSSNDKLEAVLDHVHEKINVGSWSDVPIYILKSITIASYLRLLAHLKCNENDEIDKQSFKIIDFGILFGSPLDAEPQLLQKCATILNSVKTCKIEMVTPTEEDKTPRPKGVFSDCIPIDIVHCPSMETFYTNYLAPDKPVVLDNCMNHWPALTNWQDQNYFIKLAGHRTVAIELGSKYTDSNWTEKLITIEDFIKTHIYQTKGTTGYLAQYQLFDQIPELKEDIYEPEYCCFAETDEPVFINAWYGPKGTVSPLHYDPKHNFLAQVVGEKQLFLISPADSESLYPHKEDFLFNTSQVDPKNPDLEKYPKFKDVKVYHCILKPGQMLYIPAKWWHFVESLAISFSVSFWWD